MINLDFLGPKPPNTPAEIGRRRTANPVTLGACMVLLGALALCAQVGCFIVPQGYSRQFVIVACVASLAIYLLYYFSMMARPERASLMAPDNLFCIWLLMFHIPAILMLAMGVTNVKRHFWYNIAKVNPSVMLVVTGLLAFLLGYNLLAKRPAFYQTRRRPLADNSELWLHAGTFVLLVGLASLSYFVVTQIGIGTMIQGKYTYSHFQGRFYDERGWFFGLFLSQVGIAIISVYSATLYGTLVKGTINRILVTGYFGFVFLSGHRGAALYGAVSVVFAYCAMGRVVKTRWMLGVAIAAVFVLSAGKVLRSVGDKSVARVRQTLRDRSDEIGFIPLLMESGGSIKTLFRTLSIIPAREGFRYGTTITDSAVSAVPNLAATEGALRKKESLSNWMMRIAHPKAHRQGSGLGFSIIGEGYVNFGLVGPFILLFALGFLTRRVFDRAFYQNNAFRMVIATLWVIYLLGWVRNNSRNLVQPMIWSAALLFGIRMVIGSAAKRSVAAVPTHRSATDLPASGAASESPRPG